MSITKHRVLQPLSHLVILQAYKVDPVVILILQKEQP
jgi:hypothetical protein